MELACSGIAIWLYPILRRHHEAMALWAVVLRAIEAICGIVAALGLLALIPLSRAFVAAGAPEASYLQTLGDVIVTPREWTRDVVVLFAWGLGTLLYNFIFVRARLLPRWLAGWGIVARTARPEPAAGPRRRRHATASCGPLIALGSMHQGVSS
ncbi:MAG TPA: DUF4386 domain-containing protein [Anaerolineales bacterium]|nr:DUF4386 domain-containing protein [Anaerolineales bacterium]